MASYFGSNTFFCQNVNVEHKVGESLVKEPVSIWAFLKGRFQTVGAGRGGGQRCNGNIPMVRRGHLQVEHRRSIGESKMFSFDSNSLG